MLAGTSQLATWLAVQLSSVLPNSTSLRDTAELYAKAGVAAYDGNIQGWYTKYNTLYWRPVTAIR